MVGKSTFGRSLTGSWPYAITPKIRTAAMSSVVMTGRRMKSAGFMTRRCGWISTRAPGTRRSCPSVTTRSPAFSRSSMTTSRARRRPTLTAPRLHGEVGLHDEHVGALLSGLHGLGRDDHRAARW